MGQIGYFKELGCCAKETKTPESRMLVGAQGANEALKSQNFKLVHIIQDKVKMSSPWQKSAAQSYTLVFHKFSR